MAQGIVIWVEDMIQHQEPASCRHFVECKQQETQIRTEIRNIQMQGRFRIASLLPYFGRPQGAPWYESVRLLS